MPRFTPRDASIEGRIGKPAPSLTKSIRICASSFVLQPSSLILPPSDFGLLPRDRPSRRVKPFEQSVARVAGGAVDLVAAVVENPAHVAHQPEVPVGRAIIFKHQLPTPRAVLAAAKNYCSFHHFQCPAHGRRNKSPDAITIPKNRISKRFSRFQFQISSFQFQISIPRLPTSPKHQIT